MTWALLTIAIALLADAAVSGRLEGTPITARWCSRASGCSSARLLGLGLPLTLLVGFGVGLVLLGALS